MTRIWHPYTSWEDYQHGMWRVPPKSERPGLLVKAVEFTGDADLYGSYMLKVIQEWPTACEHNLTDVHQNRQAWIGHAAACLALGLPEDATREAWGLLTQNQQDKANAKADEAIKLWEETHEAKNPSLHRKMGKTRVP